MSPLPGDWKPCLDERIHRIYYYNVKTQQTQWAHPLDEHFEKLVKKKRQEESISAGDDDSKTSIKEDLKSFEEAVTTSDMISTPNLPDGHKSRLTTANQMSMLQSLKDPSPDRRKVLNPIGRPPLPPKRRAGSTSPKRGSELSGLGLRLSPGPSPTRIDIDSLGFSLSLPSPTPELKADKQPAGRTPAIKLTGGGSAFLKSKQKITPSPSEETKLPRDEASMFGIVREAESIDSPEDEKIDSNDADNRGLKHSVSLGESGFDKLIKSKRFGSLQESLLSLKNEMDLSNHDDKSSNKSTPLALRGILRDKPTATGKLWDIDPALLTSEEKEKLRIQEMKDERKQNVRFADIDNKPINIQFSKSDSEDDSITDSTNDLEDLILEQVYSDEEIKKEINLSEKKSHKVKMTADFNENLEAEQPAKGLKLNEAFLNRKESNKNILSRLSDLNLDSEKRDALGEKKKKMIEIRNNNTEDSDDWLTDKQNIMNQNDQKVQKMKSQVFDNSNLEWDSENNTIDKHITDVAHNKHYKKGFLKSNDRPNSPSKLVEFMEILEKDPFATLPNSKTNMSPKNSKQVCLKQINLEDDNSNFKSIEDFHKSKLMTEMDLQKVFKSMRESIANSDISTEGEPMQTSPLDREEVESKVNSQQISTGTVPRSPVQDKRMARKFDEYREQQKRHYEDKKTTLILEFEESMLDTRKELQRQESLERQRLYMEVQQNVTHYKGELDAEKEGREKQLRNDCEVYLRELEQSLEREKDLKIKKIKEDHEAFLKEQENKVIEEKSHFEEETKIRLKSSSSQLEKIMLDLKQKEEKEVFRLTEESNKRIDDFKQKIELEQAEQEKKHKQELEIVEAEYNKVLTKKQGELERLREEHEAALAAVRSQQDQAIAQLTEQHCRNFQQLQEQCKQEEELMRKRHSEKMESLNAQLNRTSEKEDITQLNREFEKVRCEKRLLEDKYKSLKEKYMRLKNEVRLSMERKRQAKLNRQLQQRDTASTTEDTTERSTDHGKPPLARKKLTATISSDEATGENPNGTPKTIKRRPKHVSSVTTSSVSAPADTSGTPPAKPKNVWNPSPHQRREGASLAEDNHTSVSEEIQMEQDDCGEKWTQLALSPLDNLRKQLEKLDDLEEQFPTSVHMDTYLRYPFSGPAGASCELDFYRHRLHLERESVRRAKQALSEQRHNIESRQLQLRHKQHTETLQQLHQEEREVTDMEVSLHRTRALLGEKIIRLKYLEQSIERAATFTPHHSQDTTATNTDSSGFSGSDLDLSNTGQCLNGRSPEMFWTENVLQSLENINSEIREIWTILGKQQVPVLNYERRAIGQGGVDTCTLAPHRANDIADRTRRLKEWLIRTRDQQTHLIAPVTL